MSDQNKNAQPSSSEAEGKNAGGVEEIDIDDLDGGMERVEPEDHVEHENARQAGGGRQSESEKPASPDSRWGSRREH